MLGTIGAGNPASQQCGPSPQTTTPLGGGEQGRCGFGPRLPMIIISPYAKKDFVDHNLSDQASFINFVEYNWNLPGISGSFDQALSATDASEGVPFDLAGMFDFSHAANPAVPLDASTGQVALSGAYLVGRHLQGQDFANGNLSSADLDLASLRNVFAPNVNLGGASLVQASLKAADLEGANLSSANLGNANLTYTDLSGATLSGAQPGRGPLEPYHLPGWHQQQQRRRYLPGAPELARHGTIAGAPSSGRGRPQPRSLGCRHGDRASPGLRESRRCHAAWCSRTCQSAPGGSRGRWLQRSEG